MGTRVLPCLPYWSSVASRFRSCLARCSSSSSPNVKPGLSYWHEPGSQPILYATLGQVVADSARRFGDREAVVSVEEGVRLSFNELLDEADRVAAGFQNLGLKRGDRIAIWAPNTWKWVVCRMAAARAGMLAVDMNPLYREQEAAHCLRLARVAAVIAVEEHRGLRYHEILAAVAPELPRASGGAIRSAALPELRNFITLSDTPIPGAVRYAELVSSATAEMVQDIRNSQGDISPDSGCNIQFSSGTTGTPKAILLRNRSIVNAAYTYGKRLCLHEEHHKVCLALPLFHVAGSVCAMTAGFHYGSTLVIPSKVYNPHHAVEVIRAERCSILVGTPTIYVDMMKVVEEKGMKLDCLYAATCGGAPATPELTRKMISVMGMKRLCAVFGLSETCAVVFQGLPDDSMDQMAHTVGKVADHTEVKIVDESGRMVPLGTPGELLVRGPQIMAEYYQNDEATRTTLVDGWLRTGDKLVLQEDGYGRVVGRLKDFIIRGGENLYPTEIENFLATHPDIIEAQVVGVPDERMGEEMCACLRLRSAEAHLTAKDIREFCIGKIATFKVPRYCLTMQVFPQTASGKVQKHKLRDHCAKLLKAKELDDSRNVS